MRCRFLVASVVLLAAVATARSQAEEPPKKISVDLGGNVKMEFVLIPAGEFMMGSRESPQALVKAFEKYGYVSEEVFKKEQPQHRVRISRPFYLGAYEVTVGQFRQFVGDTGYKTEPEKDGKGGYGYDKTTGTIEGRKPEYTWRNTGFGQTDDHPVLNVTWNDAVAFCGWLSRKAGGSYRLPTEAEWEYACRAGTQTRYHTGDDPERLVEIGNVADGTAKEEVPWTVAVSARDGYVFTAPVGRFRPNRFGLYDMHGNVCEWCADRYGKEYYAASPVNDPAGPDSGKSLVVRGGAWFGGPWSTRSAYRATLPPDGRIYHCGFRVSRTP